MKALFSFKRIGKTQQIDSNHASASELSAQDQPTRKPGIVGSVVGWLNQQLENHLQRVSELRIYGSDKGGGFRSGIEQP